MPKYFKNLSHSEFNNFQSTLNIQVTTNFTLWNIPVAAKDELSVINTAYAPKYNAIVNKQTRTPAQVQDHEEARAEFEDFIEDFANAYIIANPVLSNSKVEELGFTRKADTGTARPVIVDSVYGKLDPIGGSKLMVTCRLASDSNRASMHKDADVVEVKYAIGDAPANVDACPNKEISTKAKFAVQLNAADIGKKIHAYLRWRNNSNPEKSGPWSTKIEAVIV